VKICEEMLRCLPWLGRIATLMPEKEAWAQGEKRGYGLRRGETECYREHVGT
jgi:hypothetical protein